MGRHPVVTAAKITLGVAAVVVTILAVGLSVFPTTRRAGSPVRIHDMNPAVDQLREPGLTPESVEKAVEERRR